MNLRSLSLVGLIVCAVTPVLAQPAAKASAPETFTAKARAENTTGAAVEATIQIHLDRYTPDFDRTAVENGLKYNGYPGFLTALRKAPDVGHVELNGQKTLIRWARERPSATGRTIVVVTDKPVFFLGGGIGDAKPRAGYEVALVQLQVDAAGKGTGTMAAAARIKAGGETGVMVDDYAETPVKLIGVVRK